MLYQSNKARTTTGRALICMNLRSRFFFASIRVHSRLLFPAPFRCLFVYKGLDTKAEIVALIGLLDHVGKISRL
jgi:hypothetical protein